MWLYDRRLQTLYEALKFNYRKKTIKYHKQDKTERRGKNKR